MDFFRGTHPPWDKTPAASCTRSGPWDATATLAVGPLLPKLPWKMPPQRKHFFSLFRSVVQVVVSERITKHIPHTQHTPLKYTLHLETILPTTYVYKTFTKTQASSARDPWEYMYRILGKNLTWDTNVKSKTRTLVGKKPATGSCHRHYVRSSLTKKTWSYILFN
jgi:hypothetical protein